MTDERNTEREHAVNLAEMRFGLAARAVSVDHLSRRGNEPMQGNFAAIDLDHPAVRETITEAHGGTLADGEGKVGVFHNATTVDESGYPVDALVTLRDSSAANLVLPFACLSYIPSGTKVR
jgi:hypothetical protein